MTTTASQAQTHFFPGADFSSLEAFEDSFLRHIAPKTPSTIQNRIATAIATTKPGAERTKAMKAIRWVLQTEDGQLATLLKGGICFVTKVVEEAQVFDGRDNEELKARFWSIQLGVKVVATIL